ncbi:c-type cytochrome biogenesis protein CcmI [Vibrio fluvialis]|jgi:cytochrome c-type biogenesis protein CcmI|uniref:C-type cytochrome biogenesis protein CcmI n=1 Tax=Vibrio fluvialis TaxID=676 RepID=A0AAX2LL14_VIBFL|nr:MULTISPECIES: c-type cytochrome biogenesis protein CcmI [Vibrio]AMF93873.1 c-type cytochrome biogenesis protein CcmI [Vibrio fluvialis]EKO3371991.1 c-type cytochrome biogenesis protein CcmI [Vibrio fluvialis]EKO3384040.1 c-type cytochrome biogenesis protein CcmI [Vibrio fluvialis]EKO3429749.1 c-type cytochrome biogenesis protein CcmI [Vibrio fluvialis]EKO3448684.1 c-type cytochrome biogenesis protein CcmI [Vibrio fluvialis]
MTLFWISTLILVAIACVFIAIPLIQKKANNDTVLRDELNKAFYKDRLNELQEETAEGLVDNQQDLIADLKQSLLDDIPADKQATQQSQVSTLAVLVPSVLLVVLLSYGMYAKFGNYDKVEHWQQVSADLPLLTRKLMAPQGQGVELTDQEMEDLTLSLRTRLYYQPEDSTGWLLLGRIAMANRDMQTAIGAMKHAYALEPQDGDIQLGYAQALMLSDDEMDQTQARSILQRLAKRDYVDLRVYSLLAFDAFERADYPSAIQYWGLMQKMIGPNDSRYEMLTRSIDSAKRKMGEGVVEGKSVSVTISLADNVVLPQNAVLIVSVHSADGAPMPIAAARYPLSNFPRTVVLDDNNSMMQGRKLSDLSTLMVRVRIDTDGNVSTKDGDWFGESQPVNLGEPVEVVINKQY